MLKEGEEVRDRKTQSDPIEYGNQSQATKYIQKCNNFMAFKTTNWPERKLFYAIRKCTQLWRFYEFIWL